MTPAARIAAAIGLLDLWLGGEPAERALTNWARANRFAGSSDRAAIRDHVFDAIRCRRSFAALGGAETGRGLMLGALRAAGADPAGVFTGAGFAPAPLASDEVASGRPWEALSPLERLDCPDWLAPPLEDSLGDDFAAVMAALRSRAPVFLRVNLGRADRDAAVRALATEGITARPHPLAATALEVTEGARRIRGARAYVDGLVELQDAASQAVVEALGPAPTGAARTLDYCAGGGGKTLALAAAGWGPVFAHDADPGRMRDLPERAARAGVQVGVIAPGRVAPQGPFDLVLCDVPCSGSGAWRRQPEAKWALTPEALGRLCRVQSDILDAAAGLVAPGGRLAYATCSMLRAENEDQAAAFLARSPGWRLLAQRRWSPLEGGDGFGLSIFAR
ncbi:RsmB/NOP family class I SAM-dependent RNA methyltransferase [Palleronia sp. KMU-117]|uniref:RsmB/NOP family class I SAM-dependent RNA methyltransferase n=1 Tax=Palleronia sp. KMU-117 TaxID=3434108 RepID=UPI003D731297